MANKYNFSSDKIFIYLLLIDKSGSMSGSSEEVINGLKSYKKDFEGFPEANSIAVSISKFANGFYPEDFKHISEINTNFYADGGTALYYSIVEGKAYLDRYVREVTEKTGCTPIVTFVLFSDGEDCSNIGNSRDAMESVEAMNLAGYTTVFVAFGSAINSEFGKKMGFVSTVDVKDRKSIANFLGVELSKSMKEQSKRETAMGAEFLSNAKGSSSQNILGESFFSRAENQGGEFSHTTSQALEDDSWFDNI